MVEDDLKTAGLQWPDRRHGTAGALDLLFIYLGSSQVFGRDRHEC